MNEILQMNGDNLLDKTKSLKNELEWASKTK